MAKATSSIPTNIASKLKTKLSNVKPLLDPLPTSYLADKLDDHNKNIYATLLSAVILSKGSITNNESRMLSMLLSRLGLDGDISRYFRQIDDISENQILEFAKVLNNDDKRLSFIFDCLLASRCDKPLTNEQVEVINDLCNLWKFSENDIHLMVFWVSETLGITNDLSANNDDIVDSPLSTYIEKKDQPLKNIKFKVRVGEFCSENTTIATGIKKISEKNTIFLQRVGGTQGRKIEEKIIEIRLSGVGLLSDHGVINKYFVYYRFIPLPSYLFDWQDCLKELQKNSSDKD
ncbi:hypothetical protein ENHY17A_350007 [Moraxellaceae bacterium 17A]|nr:hypothetical protein ENHY17A_350007 [Moraxellaceae bacterium 17A]